MANFKFELNRAGVGELLKSTEAQNMVNEIASGVIGRLPEGYDVQSGISDRAYAFVHADTVKNRLDCLKNNTLLKALGGGG